MPIHEAKRCELCGYLIPHEDIQIVSCEDDNGVCVCGNHVLCSSCAKEWQEQKEITQLYENGTMKCIRYEIDTMMDLTHDEVPRVLLLCWLAESARMQLPHVVQDQFSHRTLELNMN
jgi:hypothetical protein